MGNRLTIRDEGEGRLAVYLRRAGQEFPERAGEPFPFTFPFNDQEREDLRWYLEDYLQAPYAVWEDRGQTIAGKLDGWGEALFQAVFGTVEPHAAYTKAREGAGGAELVIHANNPTLLGLPWELLKDPARPTPLALDPDFAIIDRTFEVQGAATEVRPGESLRVLMVIARPMGIQDVGYQMVARPLLERLQAVRGRVELEVLRPPTMDALEDRLRRAVADDRPYQVLCTLMDMGSCCGELVLASSPAPFRTTATGSRARATSSSRKQRAATRWWRPNTSPTSSVSGGCRWLCSTPASRER